MATEKKYEGWIISDSLLKRSAAIWGHYFVFNLIIGFILFLFFLIFGLIFGITDIKTMIEDEFKGNTSVVEVE